MTFIVYSDGGSRGNPGNSGIGVAIYTSELSPAQITMDMIQAAAFEPLVSISRFIGEATNNQAEWQAVLIGISWIVAYSETPADIVGVVDSELVQRQIMGRYKVKHPLLQPLFAQYSTLKAQCSTIEYHHVLRDYNSLCDTLANQAMDTKQTMVTSF
jgi:ribonuclease HI